MFNGQRRNFSSLIISISIDLFVYNMAYKDKMVWKILNSFWDTQKEVLITQI